MNVLVTSSRMPFALDEIRKLGEAGHTVYASDTFAAAAGNHSRWVEEALVTASPRWDPLGFLQDVTDVVSSREIELIVPCFEEVFYIACHLPELPAHVFAPEFDTLALLHDKARLLDLAREIGVNTPETIAVTDQAGLESAIRELPEYFARATHSRGGVQLLTNTGPLAGVLPIAACHPTAENPWIVQEFLQGLDVCAFAVARQGKVVAQSAYVHPKTFEHAGGIVFESVVHDEAFEAVHRFVEATNYHGQVSFDFMDTDGALYVVECNPRPTAGVTLMPTEMFAAALFDPRPDQIATAPAGVRRKLSMALIRDMLLHWREIPSDLQELLSSTPDIYAARGDLVPALYQLLSYGKVAQYRREPEVLESGRTDLAAAYFHDICWNGQPIP